jgi:AraC family transcriptional regulator of adaptative response / DNA-3-methyladenine glycosylase II
MDPSTAPTTDDACYLALKTRDSRFDGRFFTGVTSTGIYCRPVCKVRLPRRDNCRFFVLAAQAEHAGFRPCLRCRPELAPASANANETVPWSTQDASSILAQQAARLLDSPEPWCDGPPSAQQLAARLGISERHARRVFEAHWGVSPLQYLQTRRLLSAKQLLTDTPLPIADVARLSGFASLRGFNAAFATHYRLQPRLLRKAGAQPPAPDAPETTTGLVLQASYRAPYDVDAMLAFFATRAVPGMELVNRAERSMARTVAVSQSGHTYTGWVQVQFVEANCTVQLRVSETLIGVLPLVLARLHDLLDLDADPAPINAQLESHFPGTQGLRVPGTMDGFELAVRAILGQQITVAAARTLTTRLVARFGIPLATPFAELTHGFPSAAVLAAAASEDLGALGIVRQRQTAIAALAQAVADGTLTLHSRADVPATLAALQALPGIGPWTANYIAMRALRWPDAFPAGDVALHKALGVRDAKNPAQEAERASQAWRPWRSYAVLRAWSLQKQ